ncbi:MAG: cytochrome-c peroxidase [Ferruginibacter sp.]
MKIKISISIIVLFIAAIFFTAAKVDDGFGAYAPTPIKLKIPEGWPKPTNDIFAKNKLTEQGFELGRKLFYDGRLSKDGEVSCASCHQQFASFATFDHDLSHGVNNTLSTRNAPALINLAWMTGLHWDGGVNHIEVQPLSPITAANEMGEKLDSIIFKLKQDSSYKRMFKAAFGDPLINSQRMLKALSQYTGSLISCNSKYDKVMRGEASFNHYEQNGYNVFKAKCAGCHKEPLFTDNSYRNNGLPLNRFNDIGRQKITNDPKDSLKFKVPTLRNVQVSFPYTHDGHIFSLYQVVEHYRTGIVTSQPTLDSLLKNRITVTPKEKNDLVYFLYTLTDSSFIKDPRFGPPMYYSGPNIISKKPAHVEPVRQ